MIERVSKTTKEKKRVEKKRETKNRNKKSLKSILNPFDVDEHIVFVWKIVRRNFSNFCCLHRIHAIVHRTELYTYHMDTHTIHTSIFIALHKHRNTFGKLITMMTAMIICGAKKKFLLAHVQMH